MPGHDPGIHVYTQMESNNLMLSLSKYEVVALVLRQAQDEGSVRCAYSSRFRPSKAAVL